MVPFSPLGIASMPAVIGMNELWPELELIKESIPQRQCGVSSGGLNHMDASWVWPHERKLQEASKGRAKGKVKEILL